MKTNNKKQCCKDCQGGSPGKNEACKLQMLAATRKSQAKEATNTTHIS